MRCFRVRTLASRFSLLAWCLFAALSPGRGLVLCFGLDGHVDVGTLEAPCSGCAGATPEAGSCSEGSRLTADVGCCPCVDLPLHSPTQVTREEPLRVPLRLEGRIAPATIPPGLASDDAVSRRGVPRPPVRASGKGSALGRLRSVILLT